MQPPPSLGVVITAHNYGRYIEWAIRSALMQSNLPAQVIVVDDASTDNTAGVVAALGTTVEYHRVDFRNAQHARNAGLALVRTELVLFLDADDFLAPDALAQLARAFVQRPGLKLAYGDLVPFGDPDEIRLRRRGDYWAAEPFSLERLRFENYIQTSALVRRAGFAGFDARINRAQEWDAWLGYLSSDLDAVHVPVPVLHYRVHGKSLTRKTSELVERLKVLLKHGILEHRPLSGTGRHQGPAGSGRGRGRGRMIVYCHGSAATEARSTIAAARQSGLCGSLVLLARGNGAAGAGAGTRFETGGRLHVRFSQAECVEAALRENIAHLGDPYLEGIAVVSAPLQLARLVDPRGRQDELTVFSSAAVEELLSSRELEQASPLLLTRSAARYLQYLPPYVDAGAKAKAKWSFGKWVDQHLAWRLRGLAKSASEA